MGFNSAFKGLIDLNVARFVNTRDFIIRCFNHHVIISFGSFKERDHMVDLDVGGIMILKYILKKWWHAVAQLVEALRYKPECRGFDSRWCS